MRTSVALFFAVLLGLSAAPASADLFALDLDAQGTFARLDKIGLPDSDATGTLQGFGGGFRGRLQLLFLNFIVDYQHLFNGGSGTDLLHAGLGVGYRTDSLPVVDLYVQGSIGLLMLAADGRAFGSDTSAKLDPQLGGQLRAGGGIDFPFAGDFLAIGVGADVGGHYITGHWGYDLSVNLHFGLRI